MANTTSTACYMFPDSEAKCTSLVVFKNLSASLSVIGSLLTLGTIILFRKYRDFSQRLIASLAVSALLHGLSCLVTQMNDTATGVCVFQGALMMFAISATCIWIVVIMMNIYWIVVYGNSLQNYEKILFIVCWILPFVFMVIPFFGSDVYGPAGVWCWMRNLWAWRFGFWYILRIISVIVFIIVSIRLIYYIKQTAAVSRNVTDGGEINMVKDDIKTLRIYPVVYFLFSIFSIINRIHNAAMDNYNFTLSLLQTMFGPLIGAILALVFLLDPKTRQMLNVAKIKDAFRSFYKPQRTIFEFPSEMEIVQNESTDRV